MVVSVSVNKIEDLDILKHQIDDKYLEKINISLADFGTYCSQDNYYDEPFGTRYYQAPEIILMGKCSYPVDIWALGCVFYELLTGRILFDPDKDSKHSRDEYHLYWINSYCGDFPIDFLKKTKHWKKFFDNSGKLANIKVENNPDFLKESISHYITEDIDNIYNLIKGMLNINPNKRFNVDQCYRHKLFDCM